MNTRKYSDRQEKSIAKAVNGKQIANSGATAFSKGDIRTKSFLIEAKTKVKESKSFTIQKAWIDKNKEEAFAMGKSYSALAFDFGDDENYYIINEKLFKYLVKKLESEE